VGGKRKTYTNLIASQGGGRLFQSTHNISHYWSFSDEKDKDWKAKGNGSILVFIPCAYYPWGGGDAVQRENGAKRTREPPTHGDKRGF